MRDDFTLFELPLVADEGSALAHPPMRCSFEQPSDSGVVAKVWVRHRASGAASLCILWRDVASPVRARLERGPSLGVLVPADLPVTEDEGKVVELVG